MGFRVPSVQPTARSGCTAQQLRQGFTLVELLLVVAIIVVFLAVVMPEFAGSIGGTRLQVTAQGAMRMSRYARSMAVLQQQPAYLVFGSNGVMQVITQVKRTNAVAAVSGSADAEESDSFRDPETAAPKTTDGDSVTKTEAEKAYERVKFKLEYLDSVDPHRNKHLLRRAELASDEALDRILYRSNGTCRPYKLTILDADDPEERSKIEVKVDMLGQAKIVGEGED